MKSLNLNSQFDNRGWYIYWALVLQLAIVIANKSLIWLWSLLILLLFITAYKNQRYFLLVEMIILFILGFFLGQPTKAQIPTATQIIANPDQIKINNDWISGTGKLLDGSKVSFSGSIPAHSVIPDQKVLIKGDFQWQKITAATNIGEFDFQKYYRYQKIYYRGVAKNIQLNAITKKSNILDYLHIIRFRWLNSLKKLPHWLRVNASSLLLGDFDANEADLRQGLTNLGIIHIFSISGLHVYMLVDFIIKITSWARCPRERIDILLLFFLPLFAIIAGSGVGVWRACGLQSLQIIKRHFHWQISRHDCFALVLLGQTLFDPYLLFSLAGQLSYLLSYGLIVIPAAKPWQRSLLINLLSLPVIIYHNYSFSWLTFLANIILTPVFESLIIPLTIFSLLIQKFSVLLKIIESGFTCLYKPVLALADSNWTQITTGHINIFIAVLLVGITLLAVATLKIKWFEWLLLGYCLITITNRFPLRGEITFIDIGQGDSILMTTPGHRQTCLIDTGGRLNFGKYKSNYNRVEQITIPYLKYRGITHLDYVFLSHQDADHIGDLHVLLKKFPVHQVIFADGMQQNHAVAKQLLPFKKVVQFKAVHVHDSWIFNPEFKIKVLWPKSLSRGINEDSLTLLVQVQNKKWLFSGDLNRDNELKLFKHPQIINYLKAGHHGSKTASDPKFLQMLHPQLVLISAGRHNRYGHPSPETIVNLKHLHIPSINTADQGMINWYYTIWHQQTWKLFLKEQQK